MATFIDFGNDFFKHPDTDDLVTKKNDLAIKQAIRNLFFAEKPFHPEIGLNTFEMLFESFDPVTEIAIKRRIIETIARYEPRVNVISVSLNNDIDNSRLGISLFYKTALNESIQTIDIFLERIR